MLILHLPIAKKFYTDEKMLYCGNCFKKHAKTCYICQEEILDFLCSGFGKQWHRNCLRCGICNKEITKQLLTFHNELPVHIECFKQKFRPKCLVCNKVCTDQYYEVEGDNVNLLKLLTAKAMF